MNKEQPDLKKYDSFAKHPHHAISQQSHEMPIKSQYKNCFMKRTHTWSEEDTLHKHLFVELLFGSNFKNCMSNNIQTEEGSQLFV